MNEFDKMPNVVEQKNCFTGKNPLVVLNCFFRLIFKSSSQKCFTRRCLGVATHIHKIGDVCCS